jgi:hypothetical protein
MLQAVRDINNTLSNLKYNTMKNTEEKIIMYDSPEAAVKVVMDLWRSSDGRLAVTEETARYNGCTHKTCECGGIMKKGYTKCDSCSSKLRHERFMALPFREWDGKEPVCTTDGDKYFFSEDELIDFMQDDEDEPMTEIDLLICEPNNFKTVDEDYWSGYWPEDSDGDLPKEMQAALDNLNAVIKKMPAQSYSPGKIRTSYKV